MKNLFIPYELAVTAKKKGFDEPCLKVYDTMGFVQNEAEMDELNLEKIPSPIYQQIVDWFREKHGMIFFPVENGNDSFGFSVRGQTAKRCVNVYGIANPMNYYEALNKAIEEAFKLI